MCQIGRVIVLWRYSHILLEFATMAKIQSTTSRFPFLPPISGVRIGAVNAGIRYRGRKDLMLAVFARPTSVAGVFTRSSTPSGPVQWDRSILIHGKARALVVNSGNANAWTGDAGIETVKQTVRSTAAIVGCSPGQVYVSSTGVIGEALPTHKIIKALPKLYNRLAEKNWVESARAIMTTDTFPKGATRTITVSGRTITINGLAKGSGMISPNMGTMLAYIFTDAQVPAKLLQRMLVASNKKSFNSITVDGDISTSDTVLAFATGAVPIGRHLNSIRSPCFTEFREALDSLMTDLAQQIVRDGEGASKFITISVVGAASPAAARNIAFSVANSPLVKTAVAGSDPNWGRIVMAIGKAGERINAGKLQIAIGPFPITENGSVRPDYDEEPVAMYMRQTDVEVFIDAGVGNGRATVWTCDLTHDYITINADYRS